ncbi:MAG: helix-turn-helix transcriptional regulator [Cyclobacteriaceae bacterium]|nr:helix-turn-helix transcriptional regulator [Cyclobacteriaceae bacterium]
MDSLGHTIRKLREDNELPLRTVAAFRDIDQAILSKIERGQRNANREQVAKLAEFIKVEKNELLVGTQTKKIGHKREPTRFLKHGLNMKYIQWF